VKDLVTRHGRWQFPDSPVIPLGIDHRDFPVLDAPKRAWRWRVIYVGRLDWNKGVATLVRAITQLPSEATLDVVGSGDPSVRHGLEHLAREGGIADRIRFATSPRSELRDWYRSADLLVFPSEWDEPFGLVPLEAMACGVPVVATGKGGSGEYLKDRVNCLLFDAQDPAALARAARELADDSSLRSRIVSGGRRTASELTIDRYADELEVLHLTAAGRTAIPS
jgi:glycosyltransferase involved in cell wall biosynthesis